MKINPGLSPFGKNLKVSDGPSSPQLQQKSFSDMMQQQDERASDEQLARSIQQIQMQGDRLAKSMTVRELRAYKLLVKRFLEDTVRRGIGIKDTKGWDRRGRGKKYKILDMIDEQLIQMAEDLLGSEEGRLELLGRVGEIRGMLINFTY